MVLKPELILFGPLPAKQQLLIYGTICWEYKIASSLNNFGVIFDPETCSEGHFVKSSYLHVRNLARLRTLLSQQDLWLLIYVLPHQGWNAIIHCLQSFPSYFLYTLQVYRIQHLQHLPEISYKRISEEYVGCLSKWF